MASEKDSFGLAHKKPISGMRILPDTEHLHFWKCTAISLFWKHSFFK